MGLPSIASATAVSNVAGGQRTRSPPDRAPRTRSTSARASASPSALSPFIFQFPAMSFRTLLPPSPRPAPCPSKVTLGPPAALASKEGHLYHSRHSAASTPRSLLVPSHAA